MSQCRDGVGSVLASEGIDDRLVAQEIGLPVIDEYLSFHRRLGIKLIPLLDLGFDAIATFSSPESTRMMAERVREPAVFRLMLSWLPPSPPVQGSMLVCPQDKRDDTRLI
ncbi:hypothetical protein FOVSG1_007198 [Fusarium oxysporum f. sp. vasinfectum]